MSCPNNCNPNTTTQLQYTVTVTGRLQTNSLEIVKDITVLHLSPAEIFSHESPPSFQFLHWTWLVWSTPCALHLPSSSQMNGQTQSTLALRICCHSRMHHCLLQQLSEGVVPCCLGRQTLHLPKANGILENMEYWDMEDSRYTHRYYFFRGVYAA